MLIRIYFVVATCFIAVNSCSDESNDKMALPSFTNPLIQTDSLFSGSNWNDPHVLHDGTQFVMYASASKNFDFNIKIYRLVSQNGIHWTLSPSTAVLERSATGWDSVSVETPAVVHYAGEYHMFYTGYNGQYFESQYYRIGHATSNDGIAWVKDSTFLLGPTDPAGPVNLDFHQFVVGEPGPVVFNNKLYLYFTAVGGNVGVGTTLQVIGLMTFDGVTLTPPVPVLEPDQSLYPRSTYFGYSTPNAIVRDGKMHLYFDVAEDPFKQVKIHHAVSADGISNWVQDTTSILNREDFAWTAEEILAPSPILFNNWLYLYFSGHASGNLGIGLKIYSN